MHWYFNIQPITLQLEIRADNLGLVHIYQEGTHEDALSHRLGWSKGMRNEVLAALMNFGARARNIYQGIVHNIWECMGSYVYLF